MMNTTTSLKLLLFNALMFYHYKHGKCCSLVKLQSFDGNRPVEIPLIEWSIRSQNSIACGYLCYKYGGCESFSFNVLTNVCTGYPLAVSDLADTTAESGSIYFHVSCNASTSAAFQGFTYSQDSNVSSDALIPFGNEITFVGTSGRLQSGMFTCPLSGYYKLIVHALPQHLNQSAVIELRHNGQTALSIKSTGYNFVGNGVILYLETGDHVGVYTIKTSGPVYGSSTESVTTFTAMRLNYQTEAVSVALNANASVQSSDNVIFDHVITDVTDMYDVATGTVTIQTSGLYIVHFFVVANEVRLDLHQNEDYVCSVSCHIAGQLASCANIVILKLLSGDKLSLRSQQGFENLVYGAVGKAFTTLSAHIIATEGDIAVNCK